MLSFAVFVAQAASNPLTDNEQRFLLWSSLAMGTILVGLIGYIGRRVLKQLDTFADDRTMVMEKVESHAEEHRREMKGIYQRIYEWNKNTTDSLSEVEIRLGRIEDRLPFGTHNPTKAAT